MLRTHKLGEADRIITLLTRHHGRVRAVAKGVRRTTSKFGSRLEPFTHVDLQLAEGRNLDIVTQAETRSLFHAGHGRPTTTATPPAPPCSRPPSGWSPRRRSRRCSSSCCSSAACAPCPTPSAGPLQVLDSYVLRSLVRGRLRPDLRPLRPLRPRGPAPLVQPLDGRRPVRHLPPARLRRPGGRDPARARRPARRRLAASSTPPTTRHLREASGLVAAFLTWHLERQLRSWEHIAR